MPRRPLRTYTHTQRKSQFRDNVDHQPVLISSTTPLAAFSLEPLKLFEVINRIHKNLEVYGDCGGLWFTGFTIRWRRSCLIAVFTANGKPPGEIVHHSIIKPQNGIPFRKNAVAVIALMAEKQVTSARIKLERGNIITLIDSYYSFASIWKQL
ncbi:hypothetical protein BDQ17DRAFT_1334206 [Cyathus striatus]|nr:hypothetical protein BDQ17DRAFT_1334206 [Cyathus striatus]